MGHWPPPRQVLQILTPRIQRNRGEGISPRSGPRVGRAEKGGDVSEPTGMQAPLSSVVWGGNRRWEPPVGARSPVRGGSWPRTKVIGVCTSTSGSFAEARSSPGNSSSSSGAPFFYYYLKRQSRRHLGKRKQEAGTGPYLGPAEAQREGHPGGQKCSFFWGRRGFTVADAPTGEKD